VIGEEKEAKTIKKTKRKYKKEVKRTMEDEKK